MVIESVLRPQIVGKSVSTMFLSFLLTSSLRMIVVFTVLCISCLGSAKSPLETTAPARTFADYVSGPYALPPPVIVDRLLTSTCSRQRRTTATVSRIMLHFTSAVAIKPRDPFNVRAVLDIFTSYTVSAHYLVDRNGIIYRLVPEERTAFHAGRGSLPGPPFLENALNDHSIGIELMAMGSMRDMRPFLKPERYRQMQADHPEWFGYTDDQYNALRALLADIMRRFPEIKPIRTHIVGHDEYAPGRKTDPGELFDYSRVGLNQHLPVGWAVPATDSPTTATAPMP